MTSESNNMSIKPEYQFQTDVLDPVYHTPEVVAKAEEEIRLARALSVATFSSKPYYQAKIKADPTYLDNFPILLWP